MKLFNSCLHRRCLARLKTLLTAGALAFQESGTGHMACLLKCLISVLNYSDKPHCEVTARSHFYFPWQTAVFSHTLPHGFLQHADRDTGGLRPESQGAFSKSLRQPTRNSTTMAYSDAAWGITTAPGSMCWSSAVRTYQKYRLCQGSRLVVKNGSASSRDTCRAESQIQASEGSACG